MAGRFDEARELVERSGRVLDEVEHRRAVDRVPRRRRGGEGARRRPRRRRAGAARRSGRSIEEIRGRRAGQPCDERGLRARPALLRRRPLGRGRAAASPTAATSRSAATLADRVRLAAAGAACGAPRRLGEAVDARARVPSSSPRRTRHAEPRAPASGWRSPRCSGRPATTPRPTPPSRRRSSSTSRRETSPPPPRCARTQA